MNDILEFINCEQEGLDKLKMHSNNLNLFFLDMAWEIVDDVLHNHIQRSLEKYFLRYNEKPEILIDYKSGYLKTEIIFDYGQIEFVLGREK